jgi:hypothetical protein
LGSRLQSEARGHPTDMERFLFIPFGILAGLIAGMAGRMAFDKLWSMIDDEEPPEPEHRDVSVAKLALSLAMEGAIFRAVRGVAEHGARRGFERLTGAWPGEAEPEPE